ncbi:MAG: flagellar hook-length control protein FliK [Alkalispirochaeta sp.]
MVTKKKESADLPEKERRDNEADTDGAEKSASAADSERSSRQESTKAKKRDSSNEDDADRDTSARRVITGAEGGDRIGETEGVRPGESEKRSSDVGDPDRNTRDHSKVVAGSGLSEGANARRGGRSGSGEKDGSKDVSRSSGTVKKGSSSDEANPRAHRADRSETSPKGKSVHDGSGGAEHDGDVSGKVQISSARKGLDRKEAVGSDHETPRPFPSGILREERPHSREGITKDDLLKRAARRVDRSRDGTANRENVAPGTDSSAERIVKDIEVRLDTEQQARSGDAGIITEGVSAGADANGEVRDGDLSSFLTRLEQNPATGAQRSASPAEAAGALARRLNGELGGTIVRQAKVMLKEAEQAEIRLIIRPPELGRVRINLQMENGHIAGRILVDNGNVRDAIEQNLAALQRAFAEAGLEIGDFEVSTGDRRQEAADDGSSHSGQRRSSSRSVADRFSESIEPIIVSEHSHRRINLVA